MTAQIIIDPYDPGPTQRSRVYRPASTVCVIPTRGMIPSRVVQSWWNLSSPMNQNFHRMFISGMEVGAAYTEAVNLILATPGLDSFEYLLTLEEDNIPPPDGLLKLIESLESNPQLSAVGGLYYTKGEYGQPMCYGSPDEFPLNFRPIEPKPDDLTECNGLGMGFTLFRLSMFKDERLRKPWFETVQRFGADGAKVYTQDLWFFEDARKHGHRFACDSRVRVGHYDATNDMVW